MHDAHLQKNGTRGNPDSQQDGMMGNPDQKQYRTMGDLDPQHDWREIQTFTQMARQATYTHDASSNPDSQEPGIPLSPRQHIWQSIHIQMKCLAIQTCTHMACAVMQTRTQTT
jgi:hypothetical protein